VVMDTSGTVGLTRISIMDLIDDGARRAGKLSEELTVQQIQASKRALYYLLSDLVNIGIQYWCIDKKVYGLKAEQYVYDLPVGAVDTLNVLYRTMNRPSGNYTSSAGGTVANVYDGNIDTFCLQTSANGNISVNYGTNNPIYAGSIGILPYVAGGGSATWNIIFEYSIDGSTWSTLDDLGSTAVTDNQWIWTDIDPGQSVIYYRVRVYTGTILALRELYIGNNSLEVQMARLNRDDYTNLPNKNFTANQPYQFWLNRTIPNAQITLWPTPSDPFVQMVVWYSRQIQDVGQLSGELEIPQRWYLAVQSMLAHQMSMLLPQVPGDKIAYLENQAGFYLNRVEQEERDKSPIYFAPNISVYTT